MFFQLFLYCWYCGLFKYLMSKNHFQPHSAVCWFSSLPIDFSSVTLILQRNIEATANIYTQSITFSTSVKVIFLKGRFRKSMNKTN